ncbi:hypothetical protein EAI30_06830 [Romboutsia ilealis]|uniref:Fascin domain-containing protein n=1 Tax=Romboutsia faecis TaxID=2764597 RepID=A0ABR7JKH1_9FIRM|nr:hypothetical protein [Romboutsia faecis]MBC5995431.1 hypothetical protein [Romboutsia faecis]MRN24326.1 hypothetical protein [Romboutsia ilealis]
MNRNRRDIMPEDTLNLPPTYFIELPPFLEDGKELLIVQIKSASNKKFVEIGFDEFFYAIGDTPLTGKIFSIILLEDNNILIRLHGSRFLRINKDGYLVVDIDNQGPSTFKVDRVENMLYSLKAPNGKYIRVRSEDSVLIADEDVMNESTTFKFRLIKYY